MRRCHWRGFSAEVIDELKALAPSLIEIDGE